MRKLRIGFYWLVLAIFMKLAFESKRWLQFQPLLKFPLPGATRGCQRLRLLMYPHALD